VRPRRDEHGDPMPVGVEDFVVARRKYDETEQALAMDPDEPLEEGRRARAVARDELVAGVDGRARATGLS